MRHILFLILNSSFLLLHSAAFSQNVFSSEEDLKKQANKLFEEEDFVKAYPLFSQLLSLYPKDAQYNYKFGTCLLYSAGDKEKAIPYLEYAAKRQNQNVDKEVFFYLGKAYHLNYRFDEAIRFYNKYKSNASSKKAEHYDVERQIEMCGSGKNLLKNVTDLTVLEKKEVPEADFFRSYNLSEFNAKIIVKPDDLKSSADKKKKEEGVMYLAPDRKEIYYSSYGEDGKNGKDIYFVTRTASGDLSKPTRLNDAINTKYDEDFPFLHPNGKILYFCSKGHNSMGGYDIFKSEWNESTQSWGKPVNMDFAINTPDDDILFISDAEDKSAYFSSRRESAQGMFMVYKIKLERKPLDLAIITGTLTKEVGDKNPGAKITVTKILKDEVVGVFNVNSSDGSYTLNLPNGGKFMFAVESPGFKKSSELVVVPFQQEIKPLKQEIALVNENGTDKVRIKNSFDEQIDSAELALATQFIKAKAVLEVSPAEQEITATAVDENASSSSETKNETKNTPVSNTDIIGMAYDEARQTQKEANELRKNSDAAQQLANEKNSASLQKNKEATELMKNAETMTNQNEKMAQLDKATQLRKDADELSKEGAVSLTLSNQMDEQGKAKQQQADAELKYSKDLDNAIKSGASEKKMNELLAQKEKLDKRNDSLNVSFPPDMEKMAQAKQKESSKAMAKYLDTQQDVEDLQKESQRLRAEADKTKNEGAKQNLISQAEEMEKEAETKKKDAETYSVKGKQLQSQSDSLKSNAALTASVMNEIKSSPTNLAAANTNTVAPENKTVTASTVNETKAETTQQLKITSPYVDVFVNQMHDAEKIPKETEREEKLSVIYQSWTDSLDNQIASLKKFLPTVTDENNKKYVQDKIYELQSGVEDKRQKASDSRSKVDNLKLQEALAAASAVSPETTAVATNSVSPTATTAATGTETSPENLQGADNINSYYENKLKENEKETNEYAKKSKEQEIYSDWSSSLYDESQRLKKDGKNGKADDAEKGAKEKQTLAMKTGDKVAEIKSEHPDWAEAAKKQQEEKITTTAANTQTTTVTENKTAPAETKSEITSPETTIVSTNTVAATNPVSTQTVSPVKTETITASTTNSSTQPDNNSTTSTTPPSTIKNKDEYTHYTALKNEAGWSKKNAERQNSKANEYENLSNQQFNESNRLYELSKKETDPNKKKEIEQKSADINTRALRNQLKSDSVKALAKNSEQEANSKQTESDLYLQSLDKSAYEEIATATGYKKPSDTLASTTVKTETVKTNSATPTTATSTETKTAKTETAKTNSVATTETVSTATKNETAQPKNNSSETKTSTEPVRTQTTVYANKTETKSSETKTAPAKTETANTSVTSKSYLLKYYDALFDKLDLSGASYSAAKPIPVDAPLPDGLIFKVQIGAFKNPIPQNLFKGLKPITAETTPQGFKRYTAGLFEKFSAASQAKKQVNDLGYKDAFIVAFFNGKRISMNDALTKAKDAGETIDAATLASANSTTQQPGNSTTEPNGTSSANATDVKSIGGLFYAVQVGVFSKPVTSAQLYNISPLNSESTGNGLLRYTTGRFGDEVKASEAKNKISGKGIADAFVVAYYNGKRIPLTEAKKLIDTQGSGVLSKSKQEYSFFPSDTTTSEASAKNLSTTSNKGIVFKVQIGAFKELVPNAVANKFLSIAKQGIKNFKDENGLTVYTVGEFLEYETANNLKSQLIKDGLDGAFVIAFRDGKKIKASEALDLIRNK
ncbi:MAG: PD40 domain-containing protein [Bacteroidetes bacterium]|nr:PD40 domain-containing protein [Bacteroidota bacterium]